MDEDNRTIWENLMETNAPENEKEFVYGLMAWREGISLSDNPNKQKMIDIITQTIDMWSHLLS